VLQKLTQVQPEFIRTQHLRMVTRSIKLQALRNFPMICLFWLRLPTHAS